MDPPRRPFDPKIRHVGFFAPGPPPDRTRSGPAGSPASISPSGNSLVSPVMIIPPPPRHASDNLSRAVNVPRGAPFRPRMPSFDNNSHSLIVGSYNPEESVLGTSPASSGIGIGDGEFSEDSENWIARTYSGGVGGIEAMAETVGAATEVEVSPPAFEAMKEEGTDAGEGEEVAEMPNEVQQSKKQLKEKTIKAERHALQDAQRAAKPAAKDLNLKSAAGPGRGGEETAEVVIEMHQSKKPLEGKTTKAERRALQEAQRAAKASAKDLNIKSSSVPGIGVEAAEVVTEMPQSKKPLAGKMTKAERRALQEAQRAAKASAKGLNIKSSAGPGMVPLVHEQTSKIMKQPLSKDGGTVPSTAVSDKKGNDRPSEKDRKKDAPAPRMQFDDKTRVEKAKRRSLVKQTEARKRVELFRHLPQYEHGTQLPDLESRFFQLDPMHPAVHKVGLQYLAGDIVGANARCIKMLQAFQDAIKDYSTPPQKSLSRDLTAKINHYVSFLIECRPLSISMGNAIRFLKARIAKLPLTLSEAEAKSSLYSEIDRFINEKILLADTVIIGHAVTKIRDGDVLLTYGASSIVEMILLHAYDLGKRFRVVVVDSRPKLEGQALVRKLVRKGLSCTYTHLNAVSYIMHEVTRVFLGAASVLSNGIVYSRVGTACIAMVAHAFHVPVLICCEAYKFHERVQLDSICCNELGDPYAFSKVPGRMDVNYLDNWSDKDNLQLLNLVYDATPADYISMIITEYGMIPTTSVPVIVREYGREHLLM